MLLCCQGYCEVGTVGEPVPKAQDEKVSDCLLCSSNRVLPPAPQPLEVGFPNTA